MSSPLRRRLGELEQAVEDIKEAGVAGEARAPRGTDRELLERNRASVEQPLRVLGRRPRGTFSLLPAEVGTVSGQEASRRRRRTPMCYTRRDQGLEEEARRLRAEDERRRKAEAQTSERKEEKPLTDKVKEMVGAR